MTAEQQMIVDANNAYYTSVFNKLKPTILDMMSKIWKQEDFTGTSTHYSDLLTYQLLLVHNIVKKLRNVEWTEEQKNCYACKNIDIDVILELTNTSSTAGIGSMSINNTNIVI